MPSPTGRGCREHVGYHSNERLEFLGDAVLGLVVTDHIFATYPALPEGELAKMRAAVVSAATLADVAAEVALGDALLLGKGEGVSGGREKPSILADALEAVIGALYIDSGWTAARDLVMMLLGDRISQASEGPGGQDYKTRLQELGARRFGVLPRYTVTDEGPDHAKRFFAEVSLGGEARGRGEGRSKKQAEAAAARDAWESLREVDPLVQAVVLAPVTEMLEAPDGPEAADVPGLPDLPEASDPIDA